jgi:hypothetical protein
VSSSSAQGRAGLFLDIFYVLGVIACSLTGSAHIAKYFHGTRLILFAAGIVISVALAMLWLRWSLLKSRKQPSLLCLVLPWCLFTVLFALLFPIAQRHTFGPGSDRGDALRVSASALLHGHYPYDATTYLGNPITPLPGAILLATPFFLLGNVSLQNIFWLALFVWFSSRFFRHRWTAIIYLLLLLGTSAANLDDFVVGGDYFVNAMYVCIAIAVFLATRKENTLLWKQVTAEVFLGLAVDSRPIYFVVFPLLFAYLLQRRRRAMATRALLISASVTALLLVPFYVHDPAHFSPLHIREKLDFIPPGYHATLVLPALGLLASCAGFFIRLSQTGIYLLTGLSLFLILGLPALWVWFMNPFTIDGWSQLSWATASALFFSLWIFSRYENNVHALPSGNEISAEGVSALS